MSDQINQEQSEKSGLLLSVEPMQGNTLSASEGDKTDAADTGDGIDAPGVDADGTDASDADGTDTGADSDSADADSTDNAGDGDGTDAADADGSDA